MKSKETTKNTSEVTDMPENRADSRTSVSRGKTLQPALRETEERYRLLVETMNDGFNIVDESIAITYANHRLCEILGYELDEIVGRRVTDFLDDANRKVVEEQIVKRKRGESSAYELTFTRKDGQKIPTIISARPILDAEGQFKGAFSVITDVTELKQAQEALKKAHSGLEMRVDERTAELKKINKELQDEIARRRRAEEDLEQARRELERRVTERTAELVKTEEQLSKAVRYLSVHKRQLRSMASHHTISEERARRKLAVYLHDNICQSLGVAKMKLDSLREAIPSTDLMAPFEEVTQIIKSTIQDVRSVMVDLSPPVLHELGFEAALEWLAEQFHERNGIPCTYANDAFPKPLDEDVRILLFQSVRELLVNIIKHAKASKAKISVLRQDENIHVVVEDNGVGFQSSNYGSPMVVASGFGFFSIRERLSSIGGHMEIKSWKGKGSRVTLVAPLKRLDEGEGESL